jgi:membrane protease YdiL (CAAX protease family)
VHPRLRVNRAAGLAGALVLLLSAWNNVVVTRLPGYPVSYVTANVAAAGVLLAAARAAGLSWHELGLARSTLASGARWGGACMLAVALAYVVALAVPGLRPLLTDARIARLDGGELAANVLVRIPLGTVLWEEVAFRGVLLGALARVVPLRTAVAVSAVVFGIWHIRPTLSAVAVNDVAHGPASVAIAVLLGCLGTAVAGVLMSWLRLHSGSLLAPALLHLATNSLGALAAAAAVRLG